jgi:hypothetical protein
MDSILDVAWELFYENANLKDLVAGEETSWKLYFAVCLQICIEIQLQYNFRCFLPAYTESDAVPSAASEISYFSQSSFDIFIASMKEFPIPKGVYEIVDIFCTWYILLSKPYERYTLKLPGSHVLPFDCAYDLADLEAMRNLLRANWGNMLTHAKKFGLKLGKWRDPVKPTERNLNDVDVIALFNHMHFKWCDDGTDGVQEYGPNGGFDGANLTTDYTGTAFYFKDTPNESKIHVLAPFFGTYDATNNPYGGVILERSPTATEYYVNMKQLSQHGTDIYEASLEGAQSLGVRLILQCIKAVMDNAVEDGDFNICIVGANLTADVGLDDAWVLGIVNQLYKGNNRGATETNNDIINFIGRLLV